jgi:hypothetical protein
MIDAKLLIRCFTLLVAHDWLMARSNLESLVEQTRDFPVSDARGALRAEEDAVRALGLASSLYFKPVRCLQRSAVLVRLLRRQGISALMVIGVRKVPFLAHAWVEVNGKVIDGGFANQETYLVLEEC